MCARERVSVGEEAGVKLQERELAMLLFLVYKYIFLYEFQKLEMSMKCLLLSPCQKFRMHVKSIAQAACRLFLHSAKLGTWRAGSLRFWD